jgi:hypothetical protein
MLDGRIKDQPTVGRKRFGLVMVLAAGAAYGLIENLSIFALPVYLYSFTTTALPLTQIWGGFPEV